MNPAPRATRRDNALYARQQRAANRAAKRRCKTTGKTRLATFEAAVASALRLSGNLGRPIRAYACEHCGGWHLTCRPTPPRRTTP